MASINETPHASTDETKVVSPYLSFLGGATLGVFLILLPILYSTIGSWQEMTTLQLGLGIFLVTGCGLLAIKLGTQFIDAVMKVFENSGF